MKRLLIVSAAVFSLMVSPCFGIEYCKDFLESGNPGGWGGSSLKTFEDEWTMGTTETVEMDIWLNDVPEDLLTAGCFVTYDSALINIIAVMPYDSINEGPWSPSTINSFEVEPGQWFLFVGNFACVAPDGDGDIILAKVTFQCRAPDVTDITVSTIPGFETITGCTTPTTYDPEISPKSITVHQDPKPCTSDPECDDGFYCDGTEFCDIDGTDTCQVGLPADCDDGVSCTDDSCNMTTDSCDNIPRNVNCYNGLFCDGEEICDPINDCQPGTPVECPEGQICDDVLDQCAELSPCSVVIVPSSATVFTWETVQFNTTVDGACNEPCYTWEISVQESTGSTINQNGLYLAGGNGGTDVIQVTDPCNGNISDNAIVNVIVPCIPDNYEPDDFPPEVNSIAPDSCQYRSICPAGDVDWVEFELTAESGITLETSGPWGGTIMCLTDNDLNMIECDYDSGPDMWSYIQQPCLPAGTYYFGIAEYAYGVIPEYEVCLTTHPCPPPVELDCTQLLASSQFGELFRIDVTTGSSEFIGYMPPTLATEIEYDVLAGTLYAEEVDGLQYLHTIDPGRGFSTGFVAHDYGSLQGLEFVGSTLYGTFFPDSTLVIVDTATGALTTVGATGLAQISGLAYEQGTGVMYGITAGGAPANLVTIDLTTGAATVVGPTGLDRIGSIEFGPDGNLYGGLTAFSSAYATYLVRIDTATGAATPIGETGFSITGLTSCQSGIDIIFDIKPDPLNLKCKGVMPAAIVGTDEFNVRSIDPDSLRLTREGVTDGVAPIRYNFTDKEAGDMLLKFRVPEVVEVLMLDELAGQTIPLTITGITADGSFISGQDYVRLLGNIVEECNADFDCDADVDGSDALTFKDNFGRSSIQNPCTDANPCDGDFDKDRDVDGNDAFVFKSDYGKILWWIR